MVTPLTVGLPNALSSPCQDAGAPLSGERDLKPQWEVAIVSTTAGCVSLPLQPQTVTGIYAKSSTKEKGAFCSPLPELW